MTQFLSICQQQKCEINYKSQSMSFSFITVSVTKIVTRLLTDVIRYWHRVLVRFSILKIFRYFSSFMPFTIMSGGREKTEIGECWF